MAEALNIDVCICTFRRPHVAKTLRSISRLFLKANWMVRVIVADNDETPSARDTVEATGRDCSLSVTYVHAPACNISVARNACLDAATAPLIAFIDDDEIASRDWLVALVAKLESSNADVVLGPVQAVYGSECPAWMHSGDFHSTRPVWVNGSIKTGYTSNVLMKRSAVVGIRFMNELGKSGGEDTMFFSEVWSRGGKIDYAARAIVQEAVSPERATLSWLIKRRFRCGKTHALGLQKWDLDNIERNICVAAGKAGFCFVRAAVSFNKARAWLLRGTLHAGVVRGLL